jgi:hypothetical protein
LATLKLVSSLVGLFYYQVIHNLVVRSLTPGNHIDKSKRKQELSDQEEHIRSVISSYLQLLSDTANMDSYEIYIADAEQHVAMSRKLFSTFLLDPRFGREASLSTSYYLTKNDELEMAEDGEVGDSAASEGHFYCGLFLSMLFSQLEKLLDNPLDLNLIVTGIFSKLTDYPIPLLYSFLLDITSPWKNGVKTLWSVLNLVV